MAEDKPRFRKDLLVAPVAPGASGEAATIVRVLDPRSGSSCQLTGREYGIAKLMDGRSISQIADALRDKGSTATDLEWLSRLSEKLAQMSLLEKGPPPPVDEAARVRTKTRRVATFDSESTREQTPGPDLLAQAVPDDDPLPPQFDPDSTQGSHPSRELLSQSKSGAKKLSPEDVAKLIDDAKKKPGSAPRPRAGGPHLERPATGSSSGGRPSTDFETTRMVPPSEAAKPATDPGRKESIVDTRTYTPDPALLQAPDEDAQKPKEPPKESPKGPKEPK